MCWYFYIISLNDENISVAQIKPNDGTFHCPSPSPLPAPSSSFSTHRSHAYVYLFIYYKYSSKHDFWLPNIKSELWPNSSIFPELKKMDKLLCLEDKNPHIHHLILLE